MGRRARNNGIRWLRTADLIVLAAGSSRLSPVQARAAIEALRDAGRITGTLAAGYIEELT